MLEITLKLDQDVLSALRRSPDEFASKMRLAAAIHWYERGEVSQEKRRKWLDWIARIFSLR